MSDAAARTVSVVIPVRDDAVPLRRCLDALARQTRVPDEIVVVDNASSDDSAAIARAAGAVVAFCDRPGIPAAAALGYDTATGDLILRLDADCVPEPGWVAALVDDVARAPEVSAFTGGAVFLDGPRVLRRPLAAVYLGLYAAVGLFSLGHLPLFGSNLALRRRAWLDVRDRVHRADPELHDDLDLSFHLGERHRLRYAPHAAMGMSMRPFFSGRAFLRRTVRGFRTILLHWPHDIPPVRWTRLALRRVLGHRGAGAPVREAR